MVTSAMSILHKPHLDAQAKEVEDKLQASLGERTRSEGETLRHRNSPPIVGDRRSVLA